MSFRDIIKRGEKLIISNSPLILTAIGVTGTITTAYFAGTASFKAAEILGREDRVRDAANLDALTPREKVEKVWKLYIPAVTTGTLTCACIIGANRIGTRRAAAMAAAYSLSERAFEEYKAKVVETVGKNKELKVRDELAADRIKNNPVDHSKVIVTGDGDVMCLDSFSGRYFKSDMESIRRAENDINFQILHSDYATVTDFYSKIGLEPTSISTDLGWNNDKKLEIHYSSTLEEGKPYLVIDFATVPIREPWRFC